MELFLVFAASVVGSPHCAAMCGGFVALATHSPQSKKSQFYYHIGRLITYLSLGAIVGFLGKNINTLGGNFGVDRAAALVTGVLLLLSGINSLRRYIAIRNKSKVNSAGTLNVSPRADSHSVTLTQSRSPSFFSPLVKLFSSMFCLVRAKITSYKLFLHSHNKAKAQFPLALGIFSTLLPCGWLYSYLIVASGTGSIPLAVLTMLFFWAGTLPILITIGGVSQFLAIPLQKYLPLLVASLMILAGGFSLSQHLGVDLLHPFEKSEIPHCHDH